MADTSPRTSTTGDPSPLEPDPSPPAAATSPTTAVNNPPADPANGSGGQRPIPDTLDQLYDTLGAVSAGMDVRDQEADELKKQIGDQEKALLEQRQAALDADDDAAFEQVSEQLEQLMQAWRVLDADDDDDEEPAADARPDQQQDVQGISDGGPGDGGDAGDGASRGATR